MTYPVVDLHCDLLSYLEIAPERTPLDLPSRCSYPQLKEGNVTLQTMAIFTTTSPGSTKKAEHQVRLFHELFTCYPQCFEILEKPALLSKKNSEKILIQAALENASTFCEETEPLEQGIARLEVFLQLVKRLFYIGLTWDSENRFGGGSFSKTGLKEDGKRLLQWLHKKRIAIDLSHASDLLAYDIFDYLDQYSLDIPLMASHSNYREMAPAARNLPDDIAKEIIRRQGIIGLNLFSSFIGNDNAKNVLKHIEHGLKLGGEKALSFGADFFCDKDFPSLKEKYRTDVFFFPEYGNSSAYPALLELFEKELLLPPHLLEAIAFENAQQFLKKSSE